MTCSLMRLRIVRPLPREIEDFDVSHLRFGASYDFKPPLCDLLLVYGYGVPEDAVTTEPAKPTKPQTPRRRRSQGSLTTKQTR